jgi:hypothetical protein
MGHGYGILAAGRGQQQAYLNPMLVSSSLFSSSTPMLLMYLQVHVPMGQLLSYGGQLQCIACETAHHAITTTRVVIHFGPIAARLVQLRVLLLLA